jgi:hypothetical protein
VSRSIPLEAPRETDLASIEPTPENVLVFRGFGASVFLLGVTFLLWLLFQ